MITCRNLGMWRAASSTPVIYLIRGLELRYPSDSRWCSEPNRSSKWITRQTRFNHLGQVSHSDNVRRKSWDRCGQGGWCILHSQSSGCRSHPRIPLQSQSLSELADQGESSQGYRLNDLVFFLCKKSLLLHWSSGFQSLDKSRRLLRHHNSGWKVHILDYDWLTKRKGWILLLFLNIVLIPTSFFPRSWYTSPCLCKSKYSLRI